MNAVTTCFFVLLIGCCISCSNDRPSKTVDAISVSHHNYPLLQKAAWLLGSWKGVAGQGVSIERWYKQDDSTYAGMGLFIKGNVTLSQESIKLVQTGKDLYYIPTVKGQNNDQPVTFKLISATDKQLVFENPQHDFPQKIMYSLVTSDSLVAVISGVEKGKEHAVSFPMLRQKK